MKDIMLDLQKDPETGEWRVTAREAGGQIILVDSRDLTPEAVVLGIRRAFNLGRKEEGRVRAAVLKSLLSESPALR